MAHDDLIAAFTAAAHAHPDVEALLLSGSLGQGRGDAWSDVDLIVVVRADAHAGFVADLRAWVEAIAPPVLWRQVYPPWPLFMAVTADYQRYDLTVTTPDRVVESADRVRVLVDKADVAGGLAPSRPPAPIAPAALHDAVEEFLRVLGLLPLALGRGEYVVGVSGVGLLRQALQALMILEQRLPAPPGALSLTAVLPAADIETLTRLSQTAATREAVLEGSLACAEIYLPRARRLAEAVDAPWPTAMETAVRARLSRDLGVTLSAWTG